LGGQRTANLKQLKKLTSMKDVSVRVLQGAAKGGAVRKMMEDVEIVKDDGGFYGEYTVEMQYITKVMGITLVNRDDNGIPDGVVALGVRDGFLYADHIKAGMLLLSIDDQDATAMDLDMITPLLDKTLNACTPDRPMRIKFVASTQQRVYTLCRTELSYAVKDETNRLTEASIARVLDVLYTCGERTPPPPHPARPCPPASPAGSDFPLPLLTIAACCLLQRSEQGP